MTSLTYFILLLFIVSPIWSQYTGYYGDDILRSRDHAAKIKVPRSKLSEFSKAEMDLLLNPPAEDEPFDYDYEYDDQHEPVQLSAKTNVVDILSEANKDFDFYQGDIHPDSVQYSGQKSPDGVENDYLGDKRWPDGVVNFVMENRDDGTNDFTKPERRHIVKWIGLLMRGTCLRFGTDSSAPNILIFSKRQRSCSSALGFQGGQQFIYLGRKGCFRPVKMIQGKVSNGQYIPIVAHEILHAIGLLHEHNRNDRDKYVKIHFDQIKPGSEEQFVIDKTARHCSHPYDFNSAMHYGPFASNGYGEPTMSILNTEKEIYFGASTYSKWDIYDVQEMYCPEQVVVAERLRQLHPDCGMERHSRRQKRWGGKPAQKNEFPWIAHIQTYPKRNNTPSTRSASFITSGLLVTSASALLKTATTFFDVASLKIHLRPLDKAFNILDTANEYFLKNVTAIYIHPEFGDRGDRQFENDLAIIELGMAIDLDFYKVKPICLPRMNFDPTKRTELAKQQTDCKMGGWGRVRGAEFTENLHKQKLILYDPLTCKQQLGSNFNEDQSLCAGNHGYDRNEQNACKGDEGAAVACRNSRQSAYELAGVISWTDSSMDYRLCDQKPWAATNVYPLSTSWLYLLFKDNPGLLQKQAEKCSGEPLDNFKFTRDIHYKVSGSAKVFPVTTYVECLQKCCDDPGCTAVNHKRSLPKTCQLLRVAFTCGEEIPKSRFIDNDNYTFFRYNKCLYRR